MITIDEKLWEGDLMNRSGIAKFLTNHLDSVDDIKVLNINAPWGAGKTFFIEKWCAQIKQTRACVYFNAWQHDYTGDAFVSLSAVLHEELSKQLHAPDIAADMAASFSRKASRAIIAATPLLAKGIFKKAVGIGFDEIGQSIELDDAAEAAESIVESLITNNKKVMESVLNFKCALSSMASSASVNASMKYDQPKSPVYIFIDELDRCRPTFAIELLERIKHFFDVENCKFIIATDKQQLACSVKAIYGESFDSERYLRRFFDAEYMLDSTDVSKWVKANVDFGANATTAGISGKNSAADNFNDFITPDKRAILSGDLDLNPQQIVVLAVAKTFKLSLRDLQKTLRHVMAVRNNVRGDFNILLAFYLVCLREEAVVLYSQVVGQSVSNEAWNIIKAKYPSFYLYTEYENLDIHEFIRGVLGYFHMSNQEARARINSLNSLGDDFSRGFYRAFRDNVAEIKTYPALAELAHSLE